MLAKSEAIADRSAPLELQPDPRSPWRVVQAVALPEHRLGLTFRDGAQGVVDMKAIIFSASAGIFAPLRDEAVFKRVRVEAGAPAWPEGVEVAPDALYDGVRAGAGGAYRLGADLA